MQCWARLRENLCISGSIFPPQLGLGHYAGLDLSPNAPHIRNLQFNFNPAPGPCAIELTREGLINADDDDKALRPDLALNPPKLPDPMLGAIRVFEYWIRTEQVCGDWLRAPVLSTPSVTPKPWARLRSLRFRPIWRWRVWRHHRPRARPGRHGCFCTARCWAWICRGQTRSSRPKCGVGCGWCSRPVWCVPCCLSELSGSLHFVTSLLCSTGMGWLEGLGLRVKDVGFCWCAVARGTGPGAVRLPHALDEKYRSAPRVLGGCRAWGRVRASCPPACWGWPWVFPSAAPGPARRCLSPPRTAAPHLPPARSPNRRCALPPPPACGALRPVP